VNGALAARLAGIPSISTVHGMSGRMSFFASDHLIAVSNGVKAHLVGQGVRPEKITVVHNGLDRTFASTSQEVARESLDLPLNVPVVGTVSRVTSMKGIDDGLRAIARLKSDFPEIQYLVVGDGDGLGACQKLAVELALEENVRFLGYRQDVSTCLAAMDVFMFPTLKEAMGIALVEAMSCGLPIVTTNVDGIPEVVTPESGILVGPKQPDALALAVKEILTGPGLALQLGESARKRAERMFSVEAMEQATDAVYRKVLGWQPIPYTDDSLMGNPVASVG
jgi:glycosyltransferase involved in cell wall biosynthesis